MGDSRNCSPDHAGAPLEAALEEQRAFLEKAQEVAHIGSWIAELDGSDRLTWSREMYRILGCALSDPPTRTRAMAEFVHPDDRDAVRRSRDTALAAGQPFDVEHRILRGDGACRWVHTRADLVRDSGGRPVRMIGTLQDVTDRRELEDQLRQSQKLEAIGRLAGGIAHDLNNALTAIIGYTAQALDSLDALPDTDPVRQDVLEIQRAAERAESVTRQLLAFSRKQPLAPRVFQLEDAVHDLGRMLARLLGPQVELRSTVEANLPPIYGDCAQIEQTILNLAVNARDAMPEGGTLTLTVRAVNLDARAVRALQPMRTGRYVELSVADTGHGMTPDTRARIFEPFFTTKAVGRGTGLGLAMVYSTVKQSGGFIFVASQPDRGTTFRVFFPPSALQVAAITAPPEPASPDLSPTTPEARPQLTILVVEDEVPLLRLVTTALRRDGYRVLQAESGEAALALVANQYGRIDLLLTDVNMTGMSGLELAGALSRILPALRVVVMTGFASEALVVPGRTGPTVILGKPFTPSQVRRMVREILEVE